MSPFFPFYFNDRTFGEEPQDIAAIKEPPIQNMLDVVRAPLVSQARE